MEPPELFWLLESDLCESESESLIPELDSVSDFEFFLPTIGDLDLLEEEIVPKSEPESDSELDSELDSAWEVCLGLVTIGDFNGFPAIFFDESEGN